MSSCQEVACQASVFAQVKRGGDLTGNFQSNDFVSGRACCKDRDGVRVTDVVARVGIRVKQELEESVVGQDLRFNKAWLNADTGYESSG